MQGFWQSTTPGPDPDSTDYAWIGDNDRMVQRIIYEHGGYVMRLWIRKNAEGGENDFEVLLNPVGEPHRVVIFLEGSDQLVIEHLDLTAPRTVYQRIDSDDLPKNFVKDLAWAERTMNKLEK